MNGREPAILRFPGPWGIPIEVGGSLVMLGVLILALNPGEPIWAAGFLAALILSILLHEIGHAWGAIVQGVPVRRIFIYGGGGFCEQARSATARQDELIVAMGPIVNLTIWAAGSLAVPYVAAIDVGLARILSLAATLNLFLALFNLLPLMPLDGGRLFHLLMLRLMQPRAALRVGGAVGLLGAVLWLPLMVVVFLATGFILLFFPDIRMHWRMMRAGQG
jgi:stage IV sporulation protein FB